MAWNGSTNVGGTTPASKPKKSSASSKSLPPAVIRSAVAVAVLVVLTITVWWIVPNSDDGNEQIVEKADRKIKECAPVAVDTTVVTQDDSVAKVEMPVDMWYGVPVVSRTAVTNERYIVETIRTSDGKVHRYDRAARPPTFDNVSDQMLAMLTSDSAAIGAAPIPMVANFENEFADSLKKDIVIDPDDPGPVKAAKERVIQARKEMLQLMSEGHSVEEIIRAQRNALQDNAEIRMEAVKQMREFFDEGDVESAQAYCDRVNERFEQLGIMKIQVPRNAKAVQQK